MRALFTRLLAYPIEGTAPRIVHLREPIRAAGMSMETNVNTIYRDVPRLGKLYRDYKASHAIPDRKEPWAFVALSRGFDGRTGTFTYALGDVITSFANLPSGIEALEIPPMTYAVFPVRPRNRFGWPFAIAGAKRYIYETWLPTSAYQLGRLIDDFEYHDERSTRRRQPEIDLYICIAPKGAHGSQAG